MTEHDPQPERLDERCCVACGQPVEFYEAVGDGPGWWDHAAAADATRRHRVVLADDEAGQ